MESMTMRKEGQYLYFTKNDSHIRVRYDLKNKVMEKELDVRGAEKWIRVKHQYLFFQYYSLHDLKYEADVKFQKLIRLAHETNPDRKSISTFLTKLSTVIHLETYIDQNVEFEFNVINTWGNNYIVHMPKRSVNDYDRNVIKFFKDRRLPITQNFEEFYFASKPQTLAMIASFQRAQVGGEDLQEAISEVTRGGYDMRQLLVDYRCEPGALIGYVWGYLKPFEGLTPRNAIHLLADYLRMANAIGRNVKKYPKYLHSMHDIINANYQSAKKKYDEQAFERLAKIELEVESKMFSVVVPKASREIISEGTDLNHCVSSYVDRVIRGETYIAFLRLTKEKEKSLVTLEIRGGALVQAKGACNRSLKTEEKQFLLRYCKEKKIENKVIGEELIVVEEE